MTDREDALNAMQQAIDSAEVRHYDHNSDETFIECLICGEWEEHKDGCPIPVMKTVIAVADMD